MQFLSTSWFWNVPGFFVVRSGDANTTAGLSLALCVEQMSGCNITGDSGSFGWTRWSRMWRENTRRQGGRPGMETTADGRHRIVVRRRIPAPREVVYEAWTSPEGLK